MYQKKIFFFTFISVYLLYTNILCEQIITLNAVNTENAPVTLNGNSPSISASQSISALATLSDLSTANRSNFKCPEKFGYFADDKDCTKYFVCVFGEPLHESCTGGLYFSAELQTCDWPRNVLCHSTNSNSTYINPTEDDDETDEEESSSNAGKNKNKNKNSSDNEDSLRHTTPYSINSTPNNDYIGIPFKNVSNEQDTNRNYLDQIDRQNDELLSRSVDGDVVRTSGLNNNENKNNLNKNSSIIKKHKNHEHAKNNHSSSEINLNEKSTESSLPFKTLKNDGHSLESNTENNPISNKINLDFEPQPPNYAEAVPSVVDSKGGIHYSDGIGGTFGIVDELPGVLSNTDHQHNGRGNSNRQTHSHNFNVFVKPLNPNTNPIATNSFDIYSASENAKLDKDLALLERRSRKLFAEDQHRKNYINNLSNNNNSSENNNNGYQYIPVITPEKLLFQTTRNPFDYQPSSSGQRHKTNSLTRNSASRPRGRVIYADSDEDERKQIENERDTQTERIVKHSEDVNNSLRNNPINPTRYLQKANHSNNFDHHHHHMNVQPHFISDAHDHVNDDLSNNAKLYSNSANTGNNLNNKNKNQIQTYSQSPNAEIVVIPIHRSANNNQNINSNTRKSNSQNVKPNSINKNRLNSNIDEPIRHPRLNPGVLAPGSNGFIGVIFDDEDSSENNSNQPTTDLSEPITNPPNRNRASSLHSHNQKNQANKPTTSVQPIQLNRNNGQTYFTTVSHQQFHPTINDDRLSNLQITNENNSPQFTTPISISNRNVPRINSNKKNPDWIPIDYKNKNNNNNFHEPELEIDNKEFSPEDYIQPFDHQRNPLPQKSQNKQISRNPNARQRQNNRANRPIQTTTSTTTTTTTTTTEQPTTLRHQITTTNSPSSLSRTRSHSSLPTSNRRKSNKRLVVKAKNILSSPPQLASRPPSIYETPITGSQAKKCDRSICKLPDCNCGGPQIPGGLKEKDTPQLILLTFDDAVNDLNWEIYEEIFNSGRRNPNGCPLVGTFYVSHEWTDYGQVQTLHSRGHEIASHGVTHSFGEKFSKSQWLKEVNGQREILYLYGGVPLNEIRGMRAPFLQIGGNKMFEMLHEANFTYDSSMPVFDNKPPFWPYTLDYTINHECMITPCPTKSYPGLWEVGMVMWEDLRGGRCSMGDACSNPSTEDDVYEMLLKNFNRHYKTNRAPFGLFYHSAWFNTAHHRRGFMKFIDKILTNPDVYFTTNWQMLQWMRNPSPLNQLNSFESFKCDLNNLSADGKFKFSQCNHANVCNVRHKSGGSRFMKTCQPCPQDYPWVGNTGFPKSIYG